MQRRLPPEASAEDRYAAARFAADRMCAEFRESELTRALWDSRPEQWVHEITDNGWIVSTRRNLRRKGKKAA